MLEHLVQKGLNVQWVWTQKDPEAEREAYKSVSNLAKEHNIDVFAGNPRKRIDPEEISARSVELIVSANYLYFLPPEYYQRARLAAINIHGSLLPKYRGRCPNVWAIIKGERITGATVHIMEREVDTGAIICQRAVAIDMRDTGHSLSMKLTRFYPELVYEAICKLRDPEFEPIPQDEDEAFYFPKRVPEDGIIDWNFTAEQLYDWIRALSYPYPRAFTYYNGEKVVINRSKVEKGKEITGVKNGTILKVGKEFVLVKVQDGEVRLKEMELERKSSVPLDIFEVGTKFESSPTVEQ